MKLVVVVMMVDFVVVRNGMRQYLNRFRGRRESGRPGTSSWGRECLTRVVSLAQLPKESEPEVQRSIPELHISL